MGYTGEQKREYQRRWMAARRAEYFKDKVCRECGTTEQLELDHIDPTLKLSHNIWSWSETRRTAELAKCQILCKEHHLAKTKLWREENAPPHGTHSRYTTKKYRCRCTPCKAAHAETNRNWRNGGSAGAELSLARKD